ncbi:MAG TPA: HD domain-containing phosphohydrolase [Solirubrobacteraceae bacterium]|jgi:diguanylate cyclase (GGDEF)-like protein
MNGIGASVGPVERLLEDSWKSRSRATLSRRELLVESVAGLLFCACAIPLGVYAFAAHHLDVGLAASLVVLYAVASRMVRFPLGVGYVVPSYVVLVPMLLLLPVGAVPLLAAAGLTLGTLVQVLAARARPGRLISALPDAWHVLGPAAVLLLAGREHDSDLLTALVYLAALLAGYLLDLISATFREALIMRVAPRLQLRVIGLVWTIDSCLAPLGLLAARAAGRAPGDVLLLLPLCALLLLISRDRNSWIASGQHRLDLLARERRRLQDAVGRLGEALAARLDLGTLADIVLRGSMEALDADAGRLALGPSLGGQALETGTGRRSRNVLRAAAATAQASGRRSMVEGDGAWAVALPFGLEHDPVGASGAIALVRSDRAFLEDELALFGALAERAAKAAGDIAGHQALREQVLTDPLTGLGNRRRLTHDLEARLRQASPTAPLLLVVFDLDGFKSYNDTFGHQAGDAILERLGGRLASSLAGWGSAYRLGGDEFCALLAVEDGNLGAVLATAVQALVERGERFAISASYGAVLLPHEATMIDYALQLADQRMYADKRGTRAPPGGETRDVLMQIIRAVRPALQEHSAQVTRLCLMTGRRLGMGAEQLDALARAAELHDIGKVAIPDAVLARPRDGADVEFVHQHSVIGERILSAAQALRPVAVLVRASHERWDGQGHPDRLAGERIPLGARIIAACDAYEGLCMPPPEGEGLRERQAAVVMRAQAGLQFDPTVVDALLDGIVASEHVESVVVATHAANADTADTAASASDDAADSAREGDDRRLDEAAAYLRAALLRGIADGEPVA